VQDDDGDQVTTPPIVIKLSEFDFVPYNERKQREVEPWLEAHAKKKRRA